MGKVLTKPERCKQCGLCVESCPTKAIRFADEINAAGYKYTIVEHETCIRCGICYQVCPDGVYSVVKEEGDE